MEAPLRLRACGSGDRYTTVRFLKPSADVACEQVDSGLYGHAWRLGGTRAPQQRRRRRRWLRPRAEFDPTSSAAAAAADPLPCDGLTDTLQAHFAAGHRTALRDACLLTPQGDLVARVVRATAPCAPTPLRAPSTPPPPPPSPTRRPPHAAPSRARRARARGQRTRSTRLSGGGAAQRSGPAAERAGCCTVSSWGRAGAAAAAARCVDLLAPSGAGAPAQPAAVRRAGGGGRRAKRGPRAAVAVRRGDGRGCSRHAVYDDACGVCEGGRKMRRKRKEGGGVLD